MPFELTSSMLRCPDCRAGRIEPATGPRPGFRCAACGRFMEKSGPIVNALPAAMSGSAAVNLEHYKEMADSDHSILDRRRHTRNHRIKFDMISEILGLGEGQGRKSVFEAGIGSGTHGAGFMRAGHDYAGLDISATALYRAVRENAALAGATLVAGDATAIPFQDGLFDRVFCVATLHHLSRPMDGLRELIRVLKPGGRFCFVEPRWYYPTQLAGWLRNPDVEVGTFKITRGHLLGALGECGVHEKSVGHCVFTPNRPIRLVPVYDLIDRICGALPPLHVLSVVRCFYGVK